MTDQKYIPGQRLLDELHAQFSEWARQAPADAPEKDALHQSMQDLGRLEARLRYVAMQRLLREERQARAGVPSSSQPGHQPAHAASEAPGHETPLSPAGPQCHTPACSPFHQCHSCPDQSEKSGAGHSQTALPGGAFIRLGKTLIDADQLLYARQFTDPNGEDGLYLRLRGGELLTLPGWRLASLSHALKCVCGQRRHEEALNAVAAAD